MSVSTSGFINSGLVCHLDAYKHSGTGTTWSDLTKNGYNATIVGSCPYTHSSKNSLNILNNVVANYNYSISPDGAMNGIRVRNTPSMGSYFTYNNGTPATVTGQVYTVSFYGKADGSNSLLFVESFYNDYFSVNLNTQTIYSTGPNVNSTRVTNAGNGWYRYSVTFTPTSAHGMTNVVYIGAYGSTVTQCYAQVYGFQTIYGSSEPFAPSFMFDNLTQYATISTIPDSFWNAGSWTVSSWVNFNQINKGIDNAIVGHGSAGNNVGLHIGERVGKAYIGFYSNDLSGNISLLANTWYNLVYTFDYTTKLKSIYVNGVADTSGGTVGYFGTGSNTAVGLHPYNTNAKMFGGISSVSLYNRVLSSTEISLNYNSTKGRFLN